MPLTKGEITEKALDELIVWRGCRAWRQNNHHTPGRKFIGKRGIGDISGITPQGLRIECEVKTIGDTIKPEQKVFMAMIRRMGGIALLATEEDGKLVIKDFPI